MRSIRWAFVVLSLALVGCGKSDAPGAPGGTTSGTAGGGGEVATAKAAAGTANGRCPVQVEEMVDKAAPTRTYKDSKTGKEQKIGFCCERCPKKFDKDPEQYMSVMRADPVKFGYTLP